ncbi:CAP domain-containing protein [Arthrobacter sp. FW306-05-C]|uniref:CAP domain-containing protein n=1 Tax=Arthrobacter sp. FW306-05-C TaxID=2879620 RepID=UPI001F16476E|nr:CAP domain-containing protein [Arthrobacter sp. FW306-05-C]UKA66505.1 CAP domain-containing protein [Arthrobacter sp. FW306-05-C]
MAPSFIGVLCALALVSSSAAAPPEPLPFGQASGTASITLQAPLVRGSGTSMQADTAGKLTPAVDPDIRVASPLTGAAPAPEPAPAPPTATSAPDLAPPSDAGVAPSTETSASPPPTSASPATPQTASIPPLWAPDQELSSPSTTQLAAPDSSAPLSTEALVPDSNASAILTVFTKINEYRVANGLNKVKYHPTVAGLSQEWSDNIATREVIEHRASFWTDPRALNPNNGAGEVIAIRTDRDAAQLVEWWKGSPGHNAMLLDPRFNVMGAGISYTNSTYQIWGVVNFFGYTTLPAGTLDSPGGAGSGGAFPPPPPSLCDAPVKHMPPTLNLAAAAITGPADLVSVDSAGQLLNRASTGPRTYAAAKVIGSGFGGAKEVFVTDWDRDGAYDVLTQWTGGNLTLYRGIATGGFQAPITLGTGGWNTLTLAVGGWCANNRMPQILALDGAGNLFMYANRGTGDIADRVTIATGIYASRLSMVDYDADGFQDVLALKTDGTVQLYRGWGTTAVRAEARPTVATGWTDVTGIRALRNVTGLNSTGVALRRANDTVQYWDLSSGSLASPSNITGPWSGQRLAQ